MFKRINILYRYFITINSPYLGSSSDIKHLPHRHFSYEKECLILLSLMKDQYIPIKKMKSFSLSKSNIIITSWTHHCALRSLFLAHYKSNNERFYDIYFGFKKDFFLSMSLFLWLFWLLFPILNKIKYACNFEKFYDTF